MSKPYMYEIDEQRLRIQLRSLEAPLKDDQWQKFENYVSAHPQVQPQNRLKKFELNINRNAILPVVFGIIICFFSFVLFNFISIKKPQDKNNQKATVNSTDMQTVPQERQKEIISEGSQLVTQPKPQINSDPMQVPETKVAPTSVALPGNSSKVNSQLAAEVPATVTDLAPAPEEIKPPMGNKKTRNTAAEEQLSEIRPSLVSDEEEVEVLPN